jgi:outer membrane autotransporter protein
MSKRTDFIGFMGTLALSATLVAPATAAPTNVNPTDTSTPVPPDAYCYDTGTEVCENPYPSICVELPESPECLEDTAPPSVDYGYLYVTAVSGGGVTTKVGQSSSVKIHVTGYENNSLANMPVQWIVIPADAATIEAADALTNNDGHASANVVRQKAGTFEVQAIVTGSGNDNVATTQTASFTLLGTKIKAASVEGNSEFVSAFNDALGNISNLDANRQTMATVMFQACINIDEDTFQSEDQPSAAQQDLFDRCNAYSNALQPNSEDGEDAYEQAVAGLGAMIPQATAAQALVSIGDQQSQLNNIGQRLGALRNGGQGFSAAGLNLQLHGQNIPVAALFESHEAKRLNEQPLASRWGAFIDGTLSQGEKDSDALETGFENDGISLTAGMDYRITRNMILGAALGYSDSSTDFSDNLGSIDTQGYQLSLYATYFQTEQFYMDAMLSFGSNSHESVETLISNLDNTDTEFTGDTDGSMTSFSLGGGYNHAFGSLTLSPYARMEYSVATIDEYTQKPSDPDENGAGNALVVHEHDATSLISNLGVQATYAISTRSAVFVPQLRLDYEHQYHDDIREADISMAADPEGFTGTIISEEPDTDYANLLLGTSAVFAGGQTGYVYYKAPLGISSYRSNTLGLGYRWEF